MRVFASGYPVRVMTLEKTLIDGLAALSGAEVDKRFEGLDER